MSWTSSLTALLAPSAPGNCCSLLFLEHPRHDPNWGPLHLLVLCLECTCPRNPLGFFAHTSGVYLCLFLDKTFFGPPNLKLQPLSDVDTFSSSSYCPLIMVCILLVYPVLSASTARVQGPCGQGLVSILFTAVSQCLQQCLGHGRHLIKMY